MSVWRTDLRVALGKATNSALLELLGSERRLRYREQESQHLTTTQFLALFVLQSHEPVTAGQLAKSADLNPGTVTGMLDDLEKKGIVERRPDPRDRRLVMVSLTDTGRASLGQRRDQWVTLEEQHFGKVSDEELLNGIKVIRALSQLLDSL
jgi:DNA-binding MarR family transcriptional regulator